MTTRRFSAAKAAAALVAVPLAALAFGGCGGDDSDTSATTSRPATTDTTTQTTTTGKAPRATTTLRLTADPGGALLYDKKTLEGNADMTGQNRAVPRPHPREPIRRHSAG